MVKNILQKKTDCLKIVIYGPESSGKTTLAKTLAAIYSTSWVSEYARDYLQEKWDKKKEVCTLNDLSIIARGQIELENKAIISAKKFVFCDTNILVTKIWAETHFDGYCPPEIEKYSEIFQYDYYFLTAIDVPWQADDLRDRPNNREEMFKAFNKLLEIKRLPYTLLKGTIKERINKAKKVLNDLKSNK